MTHEQMRILTAVLLLDEFTADDVSARTGIAASTVRAALTRATALGRFVERSGARPSQRGRPAALWRIREDRREDAHARLDDLADKLGIGGRDAEEAAAAYESAELRTLAWDHLSEAVAASTRDATWSATESAAEWIELERERLERWTSDGFAMPPEVAQELRELEDLRDAMRMNAAALRDLVSPAEMLAWSDWLCDAVNVWFEAPLSRCAAGFAPLELACPRDEARREETLVAQITALARASIHLPAISRDALRIAVLIAVSRREPTPSAEARAALCHIAAEIGHGRVARALRRWTDKVHAAELPETRRMFVRVLMALASDPAALNNDVMLLWFDSLPKSRRLWSVFWVYPFLEAFSRCPDADDLMFVESQRALLIRAAELAGRKDETWLEACRGLGWRGPEVADEIERRIGELDDWMRVSPTSDEPMIEGLTPDDAFARMYAPHETTA